MVSRLPSQKPARALITSRDEYERILGVPLARNVRLIKRRTKSSVPSKRTLANTSPSAPGADGVGATRARLPRNGVEP